MPRQGLRSFARRRQTVTPATDPETGQPTILPKRRAQIEARHQEQVVAWLRFYKVLFTHCASGQVRSPRAGAALKRLGLARGVPDILIFDAPPARPGKVGVAFEMKPPKGGNSGTPEQKRWLADLEARGWVTGLYRGAAEAIFTLQGLGFGKPDT